MKQTEIPSVIMTGGDEMLKKMIDSLKKIFIESNGSLVPHTPKFPKELKKYEEEIFSPYSENRSLDKKRIKSDYNRVKSDVHRAYDEYKSLCVHG